MPIDYGNSRDRKKETVHRAVALDMVVLKGIFRTDQYCWFTWAGGAGVIVPDGPVLRLSHRTNSATSPVQQDVGITTTPVTWAVPAAGLFARPAGGAAGFCTYPAAADCPALPAASAIDSRTTAASATATGSMSRRCGRRGPWTAC
jgi:hypothetical protein